MADYAAIAVAPILIFLMISSLANFLTLIFYRGNFDARVSWIVMMYVLGAVAIARVAIEQNRSHSLGYAAVLGAVALIAMLRFIDSPIFVFLILGTVGYLSDAIVRDCTLIDEGVDSSDQGLVDSGRLFFKDQVSHTENADANGSVKKNDSDQALGSESIQSSKTAQQRKTSYGSTAGRKKRKAKQPGRTVMYLALAALPLFGIGQLFLRNDSATWNRAQQLLAFYLFASLSLLVTTSFLGLRRYLRQRKVEMPGDVSVAWISGGLTMIATIIFVAFFLPTPGRLLASFEMPFTIGSPDWLKSSQFGWGDEGTEDQSENSQTVASADQPETNAPNAMQSGAPQGKASGGNRDQGPKGNQSGGQKPGGSQTQQNQGPKASSNQSKSNQSNSSESSNQSSANQKESSQTKPSGDPPSSASEQTSSNGKKSTNNENQPKTSPKSSDPAGSSPGKQTAARSEQSQGSHPDQQADQRADSDKDGKDNTSGDPSPTKSPNNQPRENNNNSANNNQQKSSPTDSQSPEATDGESNRENSNADTESREPTTQENQNSKEQKSSAGNQPSNDSKQQQQQQQSANEPSSISQALAKLGGFLNGVIRAIIMIALLGVVLFYLWINRQQILDWWNGLFDTKQNKGNDNDNQPIPAIQSAPPRRFASFRNPIEQGLAAPKVVVVTFQAFEAWSRERGVARNQDETPSEFLKRVKTASPNLSTSATRIVDSYQRVVYGRQQANQSDVDGAKEVWRVMKTQANQKPTPNNET